MIYPISPFDRSVGIIIKCYTVIKFCRIIAGNLKRFSKRRTANASPAEKYVIQAQGDISSPLNAKHDADIEPQ